VPRLQSLCHKQHAAWFCNKFLMCMLCCFVVFIVQYMDRTYVMQQHKVPVFQLGLDLWRDQVGAGAPS
jgi:uncharacterized membrane protein SirB2